MRQFCKLLCISFFAASTTVTAAEIYTWKDKDGVTHFSEEKPTYEAEINELKLSPVSATVEDTSPVKETTAAQPEQPVVEKQVKKREPYQAPETETDKLLYDDRMVDSTNVRIGKDINLNDDLVDSIDNPRVEHHIVDRKEVSINNDLVDREDVDRDNVELKKRIVDSKRVSLRAAEK